MNNGKCIHHEAIEVRVGHNEKAIDQVRRMFWAIIVGLFLGLIGIYGNLYTTINGSGVEAHEYQKSGPGGSQVLP